jgi:hypothetical protein
MGVRTEHAAAMSYEDVRRQVADTYRRDVRRKREVPGGWRDGGEHNPVAERKIHIARKRRD